MHRLTHRLVRSARRLWRRAHRRHGSEHGAVAALFAVFLSSGVVVGMGALVIDVGQIALERQELQTGADAASWAIANNCVAKLADCTMSAQTLVAQNYAKRNAKDGTADAQICISSLAAQCQPWSSPALCPTSTVSGGTWVEVRTSTRTGNTTLLPPTFAGALSGPYSGGARAGACGRVAWGPPASVPKVLALGISECDWKQMTGNGSTYYSPLGSLLGGLGLYSILGLTPPNASTEFAIPQVLPLGLLGKPSPTCNAPPDITVPRGWVWLANNNLTPPDANCELSLQVGSMPRSFTLSGLTQGIPCATKLRAVYDSRQPVLVPIFDDSERGLLTLTPWFRIVGFAPFVLTGYDGLLGGLLSSVDNLLQGNGVPSLVQKLTCTLSACIYGYFTRVLTPVDSPAFGTGRDYGVTVIARTG
ncbi:pilus assembly protein TadG-related protein [Paractinoplanes maris]|uniref:pilus assembly protein TadG-related protein n=1 Tax=Paractinoplanes maris TaxID=1734446 RepID=UPI0020225D07|nr:Tad domain-containing protein [Actinoplanes maris]